MEVPLASVTVDTCAAIRSLDLLKLLYSHAAKYRLEILVPQTTLLELDRIKDRERNNMQLVRDVRKAINWINDTIRTQPVRILCGQKTDEVVVKGLTGDSAILDAALYRKKIMHRPSFLLSQDHNLCVRANVEDIDAIDIDVYNSIDKILEVVEEFTSESMDLDAPVGVELNFANPFDGIQPQEPVPVQPVPVQPVPVQPVPVQPSQIPFSTPEFKSWRPQPVQVPTQVPTQAPIYPANSVQPATQEPRQLGLLDSIHNPASRKQKAALIEEKENMRDMLDLMEPAVADDMSVDDYNSTRLESIHRRDNYRTQQHTQPKSKPQKPLLDSIHRPDRVKNQSNQSQSNQHNKPQLDSIHRPDRNKNQLEPDSKKKRTRTRSRGSKGNGHSKEEHKPLEPINRRKPGNASNRPELPPPVTGKDPVEANILMLVDYYIRKRFSTEELDMLKYKRPTKYADLAKFKGFQLEVPTQQFYDQFKKLKYPEMQISAAVFLKKLAKQDKRYAEIYQPFIHTSK